MQTTATMTVTVIEWIQKAAMARIEIGFEGFVLTRQLVEEPVLMALTRSIAEPSTLVGKTFIFEADERAG